jgi:hypothetical protein
MGVLWAAAQPIDAAEHRYGHSSTGIRLRFDSAVAKKYRAVLTKEARLGSNFGGHFRVASWGCGTSCMYWAVIDLANGRIWTSTMDVCAQPRMDGEGGIHWLDVDGDQSVIRTYSCITTECTSDATLLFKAFLWADGRATLVASGCVPDK